jgi:hypothetical protein
METTDAERSLRSLRWYAGLAAVFFGIVPAAMVSLLVAGGDTPESVGFLLIPGIPLVLAGIVYIALGMGGADPEMAGRRLRLGMALIAGADVLMLGGNALIRMGAS